MRINTSEISYKITHYPDQEGRSKRKIHKRTEKKSQNTESLYERSMSKTCKGKFK